MTAMDYREGVTCLEILFADLLHFGSESAPIWVGRRRISAGIGTAF